MGCPRTSGLKLTLKKKPGAHDEGSVSLGTLPDKFVMLHQIARMLSTCSEHASNQSLCKALATYAWAWLI